MFLFGSLARDYKAVVVVLVGKSPAPIKKKIMKEAKVAVMHVYT